MTAAFRVIELDSTIARDHFEIVGALYPAFLLVRQIPLPATANVQVFCGHLDPGLPLVTGDRLIVRAGFLQISNNALPAGSAPIVLVFAVDPASFSAQ